MNIAIKRILQKAKRNAPIIAFIGAVTSFSTVAIAQAAIPSTDGIIYGCYRNNNGILRVIDNPSQSCAGNETILNWNQNSTATTNKPFLARVSIPYGASPQVLYSDPHIGTFTTQECLAGNPNNLNYSILYTNTTSKTFGYEYGNYRSLNASTPVTPNDTISIYRAVYTFVTGNDNDTRAITVYYGATDNPTAQTCAYTLEVAYSPEP